jgi:DNA repair photolyase
METISAKTIITKTKKPAAWFGADYNMNIYRGCCHGCIYCDSRSDCYRNFDFDKVKVKENALQIIRDELRRKVKTGVIGTGAMSDPYNPFENKALLTRHSLELINAFGFGVAIDTKGVLVTRDIDILTDIKAHSPVLVKMSITTADDDLSKIIEPHTACSSERFAAIKTLSDAGIFCGLLMMPILPFINDTTENITAIVTKASAAGAKFIYPAFGLTLRQGNREYFYEQLDIHFPQLKEKYISKYRNNYVCTSPHARQLWTLFVELCKQHQLLYNMKDITYAYKRSYENEQLSLFP